MLKEIELEEVLQNLYENRPVYMMMKLEKENAIEDLFGADAFYTEAEEPEKLPGGGKTERKTGIYSSGRTGRR